MGRCRGSTHLGAIVSARIVHETKGAGLLSARIPAIVLSYDSNHVFAENTIRSYQSLLPEHHFDFCVPYQQQTTFELDDVTWVVSPADIKGTVLALLQPFEDNQWVYWCMDDRYPKSLLPGEFHQIERLIEEGLAPEIGAILFAPRMFKTKADWFNRIRVSSQTGPKLTLIPRANWSTIWMHQYIQAGVIRHLFSYMPDEIPSAVLMDSYLSRIPLPKTQVLYRTFFNRSVFGESSSRGKPTVNFLEDTGQSLWDLPAEIAERGIASRVIFSRGRRRGQKDKMSQRVAGFWSRISQGLWPRSRQNRPDASP